MACDRPSISSQVDSFTLDQYIHEYQLSSVHDIALPSSYSCILDARAGKVGFYLMHIVCGLRLPPIKFFLEVLYFYVIHLIQLFHNDVSNLITFEAFCVSCRIPLHVLLF